MLREFAILIASFAAASLPVAEQRSSGPALVDSHTRQSGREAPAPLATYRPELRTNGVAGSAAAALHGRLALRNGCLVIAGGSHVIQPIFPVDRVRWDPFSARLFIGSTAYRLGQKVALGGGGVRDFQAFAKERDGSIPECGDAIPFIVSL